MPSMQLPLRAISVFHAAAKAGSVSKAAEELNVTPSAVSQQIQALELQLGTSLMVKVGRHVTLTEAGERYYASALTRTEDSQGVWVVRVCPNGSNRLASPFW